MASPVKKNWKGIVKVLFFAIIFVFGSILGFLQSIQDFLKLYLTNIQFSIAQLVLVGIGIVGIAIVVWDARRKSPAKASPNVVQPQQFDAELSPKEDLHAGDSVIFKVRFNGNLVNGYVGTLIRFPDGKEDGCLDYSTISRHVDAFTKGKLNGLVKYRNQWGWTIPDSAPSGQYAFHIRVHNHLPRRRMITVRLKLLLFLRSKLISSIDLSKLAFPERPIVRQRIVTAVVNERSGSSA